MDRSVREHLEEVAGLQPALLQAVEAVSSAIEQRDPYSVGHQARVARLSSSIGAELGLPEPQIDGVYIAAVVHDVGELDVPVELIGYPGKLSEIELNIVRRHPEIGHAIFKEVRFPWPIADIVLQHHERLDGSGYPQGLTAPQILLESKVLAVADVVEAMSAQRPHRPAQGIKAALSEIEQHRGVLYDSDAADACLRLFAEKGFEFSD
jgi:HD-GYP domain-containing protein (c-di-GMP phosphodiesterase class II)